MVNRKIVSGGQTGADRAALDWAIAHGVRHGGWCPRGRKAEDGPIPRRYRLKETRSGVYAVRTRWNVRDSDGTVIFSVKRRLTGGTRRAREFALKLGKPLLQLNATRSAVHAGRRLTQFIRRHVIDVLNVAGPCASEEPRIRQFVWVTLTRSRLAFVSPKRK